MANEQKLSDSLLEKINQLTTMANDFTTSNEDRVKQIVIDYGSKSIVYNPINAYSKAFTDVITALVAIINSEKSDFQNAYLEQKAIEDAAQPAIETVNQATIHYIEPLTIGNGEPLTVENAEEVTTQQLINEINPQ